MKSKQDYLDAFEKVFKDNVKYQTYGSYLNMPNLNAFISSMYDEIRSEMRKAYLRRELTTQEWLVERLGALLEQADSKRTTLEDMLKDEEEIEWDAAKPSHDDGF